MTKQLHKQVTKQLQQVMITTIYNVKPHATLCQANDVHKFQNDIHKFQSHANDGISSFNFATNASMFTPTW